MCRYLLFVACFFVGTAVHAQQKQLEKVLLLKEKGMYLQAKVANKQLLKKAKSDQYLLTEHYLIQANLHAGLGEFDKIGVQLEYALQAAGNRDSLRIQIYTEACRTWMLADLLPNAKEWLAKADAISGAPESYYPSYTLVKIQLLEALGLYYDALQLLPRAYAVADAKSGSKKIPVVVKGKLSTRKLTKWELAQNLRLRGMAANAAAHLLISTGAYDSAENLLLSLKKQQRSLVGSKDAVWLDYNYQIVRLKAHSGDYKGAAKGLGDLIKASKGSSSAINYSRSSDQVFDWIEQKIDLHLLHDDPVSATLENKRFLKYARTYTKKNKLIMERRAFATDKISMRQNALATAEKNLLQRIENEQFLPELHTSRLHYLGWLREIQQIKNKTTDAMEIDKKQLALAARIYPTNGLHFAAYSLSFQSYYLPQIQDFKREEEYFLSNLLPVIRQNTALTHPHYQQAQALQVQFDLLSDRLQHADSIAGILRNTSENVYGEISMPHAAALALAADVKAATGQYAEAEDAYTRSLRIIKEIKGVRSREYAKVLNNQAKLIVVQGKYEEAERELDRATVLDRKATRNIRKEVNIETALSFAELLMKKNQYQEAGVQLAEKKKVFQERYGEKHRAMLDLYQMEAELHYQKGAYTEATQTLDLALYIAREAYPPPSVRYSKTELMMATLLHSMGDYLKAEAQLKEIATVYENLLGSRHLALSQVYNQLGLTVFQQGNRSSEAEAWFRKALAVSIASLGEKHPLTADYRKNLAYFLIESKRLDEALTMIESSEEIYRAIFGKKSLRIAELSYLMGDIHTARKEFKKAENKYNGAVTFITETFGPSHPEVVKVKGKQARMHFAAGNETTALKLLQATTTSYLEFVQRFFPTLSDRQKQVYWNSIRNDFELFANLAAKLSATDPSLNGQLYNHLLSTKAILLGSSVRIRQAIYSQKDSTLTDLFDRWVATRELLASAISADPEELLLQGISVSQLEKTIEEYEKKLSLVSSEFAGNFTNKTATWQDVQQKLQPNEVAVEILRYRHFNGVFSDSILYLALLLKSGDSQPLLVLMPNGNAMEQRYYKYYRNAFRYGNEDKFSYTQYWAGIKKHIPDDRRIILAPDGIYNQLNPLTFQDEEGKYMLERNEIVLVSNTKDLLTRKGSRMSAGKQLVLMGNPEYYTLTSPETKEEDVRLESLTGAEDEIYKVRTVFKQAGWTFETRINEEVTEESIKELNSPGVFHIATHGFFLDTKTSATEGLLDATQNPLLRSGLLLTGSGEFYSNNVFDLNRKEGILTAYEAMNLSFQETDLVVLSACETGLGDVVTGEGVYGLQRAFIVAGANAMIMSLFKVSDETTQELMTLFYGELLRTGNKRDAFQFAMKQMQRKYDKPIHWGAFTMVGGL
jgi:CHAT domain-containing protein